MPEAYEKERTAPVRVLIADDDETFCALVRRLLGSMVEEAYLDSTGKAGADAFLPKRLKREELLSSIKNLAEPVLARLVPGRQV